MKSVIIILVYFLNIIGGIIYTFYLSRTIPESNIIALPFAFIGVTDIGLFASSIIMALIFIRDLKNLWPLLLPVFLITSLLPLWFLYNWYTGLPS